MAATEAIYRGRRVRVGRVDYDGPPRGANAGRRWRMIAEAGRAASAWFPAWTDELRFLRPPPPAECEN